MKPSLSICVAAILMASCGGSVEAPAGSGADAQVSASVDAGIGGAIDGAVSSASQGCIDGQGLAEGENTFRLEDRDRRYILRLPTNYSRDRQWPVVLALHGNGGNPSYWDGDTAGRNLREVLAADAILVIAEAIDNQWRNYDADPSTWPAGIESELAYFDEILSQVRSQLCIDEREIFTMGFSGGGSFSGVLACRRTDIRAMAVGGSVIYFDEANCVGNSAAWITIGTEELIASREAYRDFFRARAGCSETSIATSPDPCVTYDSCQSETPVHYCQHPDGHIWPAFGATAMWSFFSQFVDADL